MPFVEPRQFVLSHSATHHQNNNWPVRKQTVFITFDTQLPTSRRIAHRRLSFNVEKKQRDDFAAVSGCAPDLSGNALLLGTLPPTTLFLLPVPPPRASSPCLLLSFAFPYGPHNSRLVDVSCFLWRGGIVNYFCSSNFIPTLLVPRFIICLLRLLWGKGWFGK